MKIYISGPVTGVADYKGKFLCAEYQLLQRNWSPPVEIINPVRVLENIPADTPWGQFMDITLAVMRGCDAIYMLRGWENSRGAQIEKLYAEGCGMKVMYEDETGITFQGFPNLDIPEERKTKPKNILM